MTKAEGRATNGGAFDREARRSERGRKSALRFDRHEGPERGSGLEVSRSALETVVVDARAEALEIIQRRLRDELVEAWWPTAARMAGLGGDEPSEYTIPPAPATVADGSHVTEPSRLLYLYGFTNAGDEPMRTAPAVDPEATVERIEEGPVRALVSPVPASEWSEEALPSKLQDPDWLEPRARAHDAVLRAAAETGPVLPLRFGAIFRDAQRVRALLRLNRPVIEDALARFAGHDEWRVKLHVAPEALDTYDSEHARALKREAEQASQGRAYLARRRLERETAEARASASALVASHAHEALAEVSREAVRLAPQSPELTERDTPQALNGAYLVGRARGAEFHAVLERLASRSGVEVLWSGPWPPFHFADVNLLASLRDDA